MKRAVLVLLTAVIAVSGCTDDLATEQDLREQTSDLKQHTEQQLEEDNNLVRKIYVKDVEFSGYCGNSTDGSFLPDQTIYNRDSGVQEFAGGSYLVRNGFDLDHVWTPDCPQRMVLESLYLERMSFNKTVYQNGSAISSSSETCRLGQGDRIHVEGEDSYEIEEQLIDRAYFIYSECFKIPERAVEGDL